MLGLFPPSDSIGPIVPKPKMLKTVRRGEGEWTVEEAVQCTDRVLTRFYVALDEWDRMKWREAGIDLNGDFCNLSLPTYEEMNA